MVSLSYLGGSNLFLKVLVYEEKERIQHYSGKLLWLCLTYNYGQRQIICFYCGEVLERREATIMQLSLNSCSPGPCSVAILKTNKQTKATHKILFYFPLWDKNSQVVSWLKSTEGHYWNVNAIWEGCFKLINWSIERAEDRVFVNLYLSDNKSDKCLALSMLSSFNSNDSYTE